MAQQNNSSGKIPCHVGIIMDGNGRWAAARGAPRSMGHRRGAEILGDIVRHAKARGIEYLTVYAFSTENWKRPPEEVREIMSLLRSYLKDTGKYRKDNVRVRVIGDREPLDPDLRDAIDRLERDSRGNTGINVNIALNYGGRDELVHAAKAIAGKALEGRLGLDSISQELLAEHLYTAGQPEVDLIIRTGGEKRVSNFLLWQGAYAEYIFLGVLWPDFNTAAFDAALCEFSERHRRMGGI